MVAESVGASLSRPPSSIEDFLWNVHSVLVAVGPLPLDELKECYAKHHEHKCVIERFLVVGEGGLAATLKRIPHVVTLFQENGTTSVKASQPSDSSKEQLIKADLAYRKELVKKNAQVKAKALASAAKAKVKAPAPAAKSPAAVAGTESQAPLAPAPTAEPAKRSAPEGGGSPGGGDAKRAKTEEKETLARMLVQAVVRVLQNRAKAGKGPLPIGELEGEFSALWKVPFNLQQAGEHDTETFLQKWPNKVVLQTDANGQQVILLPKKVVEKAGTAVKGGAPQQPETSTPEKPKATSAVASPAVSGVTPSGTGAKPTTPARSPSVAALSPGKSNIGVGSPTTSSKPLDDPKQASASKNGSAVLKRAPAPTPAPTRSPGNIEEFLWNIHSVIEAHEGPLPLDSIKDAYSQHLGHKCSIERFLVVGEGGLAATLRRIPHVVTLYNDAAGVPHLKCTQPAGISREDLIAADQEYRRQLQQKNLAAKAAVPTQAAATGNVTPVPSVTPSVAPIAVPDVQTAEPTATEGKAGIPAEASSPVAENERTRSASDTAGGDPKRQRKEDKDTLARMLVLGVVRVVQNRTKECKGPLPLSKLDEEFTALWQVPFDLAQAGETDAITFLSKWSNKVEVATVDGELVVLLAKKAGKAKASVPKVTAKIATATAAPKEAAKAPAESPAAAVASAQSAATEAALALVSSVAGTPEEILDAVPRTVPEMRQHAASVLQAMLEIVKKQETLVKALAHMDVDAS